MLAVRDIFFAKVRDIYCAVRRIRDEDGPESPIIAFQRKALSVVTNVDPSAARSLMTTL
jgi:hypothetical protein